jgi:hypothetical protein
MEKVGCPGFKKEKPMKRNLGRAFVLAAFGIIAMGSRASADTYTIDEANSSVTAAVYLGGPPDAGGGQITEAQLPGSDTSALFGTLNADVSGGNISFGGGSSISLTSFPTVLLPDANGGDSSSPDPAGTGGATWQIGLQTNDLANANGLQGYIGITNGTLDITGAATPLSGGSFDATAQTISLLTANLGYWLNLNIPGVFTGVVYGAETVAPPTGTAQNGVDSAGYSNYQQGSVVGNTIILPIFADVQQAVSGITVDVIFTGQIVAIRQVAVPEPSTFVLGSIGLVGSVLAYRVRRSARKA